MSGRKAPKSMQSYGLWMALTEPTNWDMTRMRNQAPRFEYRPKVSILLPTYNPEPSWLESALDSVMAQTYPDWELCVCDDASTGPHVREILDLYTRIDGRIKVEYLQENANIIGATNRALSLATGEFVGLLDHDDELAPHALFEVVKLLQEHPEADLIYSDEDKLDADGKRINPHFKPGWSPDLAMSCNYLCHFSVYRRSLLEELGGWREGFDGAQDLELVQRVGERTDRIHHIPKILYHWRIVEGSTAMGASGKPYTHERARRAIEDSLERRGISGSVKDSGFMPNTYRIEREIIGEPSVSVIVPVWGKLSPKHLESLRRKTAYPNYELLVLDVENRRLTRYPESGERSEQLGVRGRLSALYNAAIRKSRGEYVLMLAPDLEAASEDWLEAMLQHAQRSEVGAVGGKLTRPDGTVFQAGLTLDRKAGGEATEDQPAFYRYCDQPAMGYGLVFALTWNCSAVSAECMMFRRQVFEDLGGFDGARFEAGFADVDLCLRMRERGYLIVCTPFAHFTCDGSVDRMVNLRPEEANYVRRRWGHILDNDPYYNPNLSWDPDSLVPGKTKPWSVRPEEPTASPPEQPSRGEAAPPAVGASPAPPIKESGVAARPRKERVPAPAEIPPPFFIVGHGRSGTTWLELSLNSHPEIVCKGSGMFFGSDMPLYENQRSLPAALANTEDLRIWHDMRPNYWTRDHSFEEDLPGIVRAIADRTMGVELAASEKRLVGDRTPHYVSYLEEIHELYPDAKIVHVIRDGRDVAVSNIHAVWQNARDRGGPIDLEPELREKRDAYLADREGFLKSGESIFTDARIAQLAGSWRGAVSKGREDGRRLFGESYTEVHYESLLEEPQAELTRLFGFLGANRDPEVVERIVEENSFEKVTGRARGQEDSGHFNRKGVAGDWETVFNDRDRRVFEEEAGSLLAELGYETDGEVTETPQRNQVSTESSPAKPPPARVSTVRRSRENPPFFVVGHGRSGTTWSERLLNSHPEVLCIGSGMFFGRKHGLFEGRKTLPLALDGSEDLRIWHEMQPNYWSDRPFEDEVPGMVRAITDHVLYTRLEKSGKRLVGDRTPHHVSCLEEVHELYPESKVVHIIRDGRDVAVSNMHAFWNSARDRGGPIDLEPEELERRDAYLEDRESFLGSGESIFTRKRIAQLSAGWKHVVNKGRRDGKSLFGERYFEIRYESLLDDPYPELARLFGFLGVDRDASMIERVVERNSFERRSSGRSRGEEDTKSFLRKGIHGDWKNVFNERDRQVFKQQTDDLLVVLGYEKDMGW